MKSMASSKDEGGKNNEQRASLDSLEELEPEVDQKIQIQPPARAIKFLMIPTYEVAYTVGSDGIVMEDGLVEEDEGSEAAFPIVPEQNLDASSPPSPCRQPSPPSPCRQPSPTAEDADRAVKMAHTELLKSGESVSWYGVLEGALKLLRLNSWDNLRKNVNELPHLRSLILSEIKVKRVILPFVEKRKISTVYDLHQSICSELQVADFKELNLGPLMRHYLVKKYFLVPADGEKIMPLTGKDVWSAINQLKSTSKVLTKNDILDSLARKCSVPDSNMLGVRIDDNWFAEKFGKKESADCMENGGGWARRSYGDGAIETIALGEDLDAWEASKKYKKDLFSATELAQKREVDSRSVHVSNIDHEYTEEDLKKRFEVCGKVVRITKMKNYAGWPISFANVEYEDVKFATLAIEIFNGYRLGTRLLEVSRKRTNFPGLKKRRLNNP